MPQLYQLKNQGSQNPGMDIEATLYMEGEKRKGESGMQALHLPLPHSSWVSPWALEGIIKAISGFAWVVSSPAFFLDIFVVWVWDK